jgi:predicted site-specific integrase-resolvase
MQTTIPEAARRLGVSEHTVRRRVRSGELPGKQVATPQGFTWVVDIPDDAPESETSSGEVQALRELVVNLQDRISAQDKELEAKNKQIEQLHILLQQAQAALPAPRDNRPWWQRWWRRD